MTTTTKGPLRLVVERTTVEGIPLERLACGHTVTPRVHPIHGYRVARARRCDACGRELARDLEAALRLRGVS